MRWVLCGLLFLLGNHLLAQIVVLGPLEKLSVCNESTSFIRITNDEQIDWTGIDIALSLPCGVSYLPGSIIGGSESDISDLSNVVFSVSSLEAEKSTELSFAVFMSCEAKICIDNGELYQHVVNLTVNGMSSQYVSEIYNAETPSPIIRKVDKPFVKAKRNDIITRRIHIRNTRPGRLSQFTFRDQYNGDLGISHVNGFPSTNNNGEFVMTVTTWAFEAIGNGDQYFDFNEEFILEERITIRSCPLNDRYIKSDMFVEWGCDNQICEQFDSKAIIEIEIESDPGDVFKVTPTIKDPPCDFDQTGTQQRLRLEHKGSINELIDVRVQLSALTAGHAIQPGSITVGNGLDYVAEYHGDISCGGHPSATLIVPTLSPSEIIDIRFNTVNCLQECEALQNSWSYQYNYTKECANPEDKFVVSETMSVGNPNQERLQSELIIEKVSIADGVSVGDTLSYNVLVSDPLLTNGTGLVLLSLELPCDMEILELEPMVDGQLPVYSELTGNANEQQIVLEYELPFSSESITIPVVARIDNKPECAGSDCIVEYITTCPEASVGGLKEVEISYRVELNEDECLLPIQSCDEQILLYAFDGPPCPQQVPGYVDYSFDVYRTTYGLSDNDNDNIPDEPNDLDLSNINLQGFLWGDTVVIDVKGKVIKEDSSSSLIYSLFKLKYQDGSIISNAGGSNPDDVDWFEWMFLNGGMRLIKAQAEVSGISFSPKIEIESTEREISVDLSFPFLSSYVSTIQLDEEYLGGDSIKVTLQYVIDQNPAKPIITHLSEVRLLKNFLLKPFLAVSSEAISDDTFSCDEDGYSCSISGGNIPIIYGRNGQFGFSSHYCDKYHSSAFRVSGYHGAKLNWYDIFPDEFRQIWSVNSIVIPKIEGALVDTLIVQRVAVGNVNSPPIIIPNPADTLYISDYLDVRQEVIVGYNFICIYASEQCLNDTESNGVNIDFIPIDAEGIVPEVKANTNHILNLKTNFPLIEYSISDLILYAPRSMNTDSIKIISISYPPNVSSDFETDAFNFFAFIENPQMTSTIDFAADRDYDIENGILQFDTLHYGDSISLALDIDLLACNDFIIPLTFGTHCERINNPFQEPCIAWHDTIYVQVEKGIVEMVNLTQDQQVDLCETEQQEFSIINAGLGDLKDMVTEQRVSNGFNIVDGSVEFSYPSGSNNWVSISNPMKSGPRRYIWDWSDLLNGLTDGILSGVNGYPENGFDIRYSYQTACGFISGSKLIYRTFATQHCGEPSNVIAKVSGKININGLDVPPLMSAISLLSFKEADCVTPGQLSFVLTHANASANDSLHIVIPQSYDLVDQATSLILDDPSVALPLLDYNSGDTLIFDLILNQDVACGQDVLSIFTAASDDATCITDGTECSLGQINASLDIPINIDLADIEILSIELLNYDENNTGDLLIQISNQGTSYLDSLYLELLIDDDIYGPDSYLQLLNSRQLFVDLLSGETTELLIPNLTLTLDELCQLAVWLPVDQNCVCDDEFEYISRPLEITELIKLEFCEGEDIILNVDFPAYQLQWQGDVEFVCDTCLSTQILFVDDIDNLTDLQIRAVVYSDFDCFIVYDYVISIRNTPQILNDDLQICEGDTVGLFASPADSYTWNGPQVNTNDQADIYVAPESSAYYYLMSEDLSGCTAFDSVYVEVLPEVESHDIMDQQVCVGQSIEFDLPDLDGLSYTWYSPTLIIADPNATKQCFEESESEHMLILQLSNGLCAETDTINIAFYKGLDAVVPFDSIFSCGNELLTIELNEAYEYQWFPSQVNMCLNDQCSSINWFLENSQTIQAVVSDMEGCIDTVSLSLIVEPDTLFTVLDTVLCAGDIFNWNNTEYSSAGIYCDTIIVNQNCVQVNCLDLSYHEPSMTTMISDTICEGQIFEIGGFSFMDAFEGQLQFVNTHGCDSIVDLSLVLLPPEEINDTMTLCPDKSFIWLDQTITSEGFYSDTIVDMSGCLVYQHLLVEVDDYVEIEALIRPYSSEEKGRIELLIDGSDQLSILWYDGQEGLILEELDPGQYSVTIINETGCERDSTFLIVRVEETLQILMANVFSPDASNQTNRFLIPYSNDPSVSFNQMVVFDRWGNMIFDCSDPNCLGQGWDGRFGGQQVAHGVYSIKLIYEYHSQINTEYRMVTVL